VTGRKPPDSRRARHGQEAGPTQTVPAAGSSTASVEQTGDNAAEAAWRCWTWRLCPHGCLRTDDCVLHTPLPVHDHDRPCPGQFGGNGQWVPCCGRGAA
jgi:hypothetical protein